MISKPERRRPVIPAEYVETVKVAGVAAGVLVAVAGVAQIVDGLFGWPTFFAAAAGTFVVVAPLVVACRRARARRDRRGA